MGLNRRTALGLLLATPMLGAADVASRLDAGRKLAAAARQQVGVTTRYDASYHTLSYPGGDVLRTTGVCADVLVRAARDAWSVDLQKLVHEDMARAFAAYPARRAWNQDAPDANIDHRRVLNLETYMARQGALVKLAGKKAAGDSFDDVQPGDVLTWRTWGQGGPHIGVVGQGPEHPHVIHNIGWGAREESLWMFKLHTAVGHYRWRA